MTHATPRPWTYQLDPSYTTHGGWKCEVSTTLGEKIASVFASSKGEALKRAALIVHAVNTLDEAKAALRGILADIEYIIEDGTLRREYVESNPSWQRAKAVLAKLEACQ